MSREMDQEEAEILALRALAFLAQEPSRLNRFLSLSGLSPNVLAQEAHSLPLLAAVLDHFLEDQPLLLTFAANAGEDPRLVVRAAGRLHAALATI